MWQQDMSAAAENMLLEACNLGLGGLWNGVAPEEERMNKIAKLVGINDENLKGILFNYIRLSKRRFKKRVYG